MKSISVFLPAKGHSERVFNKNMRPFAGFSMGLIELKIKQLLMVTNVDEIVVSSNSANILGLADSFKDMRLVIDERDDSLCADHTTAEQVMKHAGHVCAGDEILLTHCTSPFVTEIEYQDIVNCYRQMRNLGFDSLMTVLPFRNFMFDIAGQMLNNNRSNGWPRTQDLEPWYEVTHGVFIADRKIFKSTGDKLGSNPFLYDLPKIQAMDIDYEDDFNIAEMIYQKYYADRYSI